MMITLPFKGAIERPGSKEQVCVIEVDLQNLLGLEKDV